jgi:hypothetical protein
MLLTFLVSQLSVLQFGVFPVYGATLFSDGFESGDFSAWTAKTVGTGKSITIDGTIKHHGSYSAKYVLDFNTGSNTDCFLKKSFTKGTDVYARCYFYVDSATQNGAAGLFGLYSGGAWTNFIVFYKNRKLRMYYYTDASSQNKLSNNALFNFGEWNLLEVHYKTSDGNNNGQVQVWINGIEVPEFNIQNLDNDNYKPDTVIAGHRTAFYSSAGLARFYIDCLVVADTYTGPEEEGDTTPPTYNNIATNTTKAGQPCQFSVLWNDNVNVSGFIFDTNNTGTWVNDSWTAFTVFYNSTAAWSNITKTLTSKAGVTISWRIWCNDTSNNWNTTGIQILTTTDSSKEPRARIFQDGFESGDFSAWTGIVGSPTIVTSPVHHGTYAMECDASGEYARQTLAAQTTVFTRFYLRFNALPTTGKNFFVFRFRGGTTVICTLQVAKTAADVLQVQLVMFYPSASALVNFSWEVDKWYCIELKFVKDASVGEYRVWIDGVEKIKKINQNMSGAPNADNILIGQQTSGYTVTNWIDCVVVADTYIGPEAEAPPPPPQPPYAYRFTIPSTIHDDYGLGYPVTYVFSVPQGSFNLKAYKRVSSQWIQLTEKTSNDFFNGIECVRFDYNNNLAYVSVAFLSDADYVDIKITNENDESVALFVKIAEYYDNRKAVVVASGDDWIGENYEHQKFMSACDVFQAAQVWFTVGITTQIVPTPQWTDIQSQLDGDFIEVASHSQTHPYIPYDDYDDEISGSKNDILGNLSLPSIYKKGATQYLWAFLEPYGQSDSTARAKLGEYKYLADRAAATVQGKFTTWDATNGLYNRIYWSASGDDLTLAELNTAFDTAYAAGNIYHLFCHPAQENWGVNDKIPQHLNYIKNKTDVWYVGLGALYAYHFVQERGTVEVTEVTLS